MLRKAVAEDEKNAQPLQKYTIVRGRDGMLYSVPLTILGTTETNDSDSEVARRRRTFKKENSRSTIENPSDPVLETSYIASVGNAADFKNQAGVDVENGGSVVVTVRAPEAPGKKGRGLRKVTVVVEDASDSEDENDELKSVWRNRRPSPGQWIEPVDG
jgi:hypothetical protein